MKTKILMIILIVVIIVMFFNINVVQADGISDVISGGDSFLQAADGATTIDDGKLQDSSKTIYNILLVLGICVAVVVAAILGIKFMIGSMEEKAQVKEALIPFVVGCVVIFGAFGIWKIFVTIGNDVSDETQLDIATNYVRSEDGKTLYKKGELYHSCGEQVTTDTLKNGYCSKCHVNFQTKCSGCKKILTKTDFINGWCSQCHVNITNNPFTYYK